ncbi:hypothetical protein B6U55_07015 [Ligilactobacillus salivarius]|uniref:helix-turn-helix domain-containing protein n=1 Tax=Ligilactobacillus salivarius TaxID=1624 RepID=UPI0009D96980|nr:helix-turn-helix transcriptional regulator [Ligilactobacillus salivarius]OQQ91803.1 hypothetical protein B6U55_07015 [Ligilactobacillus salivarius]
MGTQRIKDLRKLQGLTQIELADKLGVSLSSVAMWETGKRVPGFKTLNDLSELFDKSIEYILGTSDDDRSVKLSDKQIDQLGEWEIQSDLIDICRQYLSLDEYGKMNVNLLIKRESLRCQDQGTSNDISHILIGLQQK